MPPVVSIDASFPLFDLLQSASVVMLVSPSLTSRLRHLLEIFVLNAFATHLASHASGAGHGGVVDAVSDVERALVPYLERTLFRQNITCSFVVIAGFLASWVAAERFRVECAVQAGQHDALVAAETDRVVAGYTRLLHALFSKLHVLVASPLGQVRTIAQYFFFALFVEAFHADLFVEGADASAALGGAGANGAASILPKGFELKPGLTAPAGPGVRLDKEPLPLSAISSSSRAGVLVHLYFPLWLFLHRSTGVASVRVRQDEYFRAFRPFERATVEGLLRYSKEYRFEKQHASSSTTDEQNAGSQDDAEEDAESEEATQLLDVLPASSAGSVAAASGGASAPSLLSSYGTALSNQDLLLYIRRITNEHLHSLTEERESSYFDDRNQAPVLHSIAAAGGSSSLTAGASSAPEVGAQPPLNFQQKIAPARAQFLEDAEADALGSSAAAAADSSAASVRLPVDRHLVICASLVSKPVNLGGLCRTAEIMTSTLVLPDERLLSDATFVGVSSTANRWADIRIVPPEQSAEYLADMRERQGYAIVGLEQTVHSAPLQHVQFPSRVVLVLGDEKRGIPAPILAQLTLCVEIPQLGRIRSLNVHASGAMLVWEWMKQSLLEQEASASAIAAAAPPLLR